MLKKLKYMMNLPHRLYAKIHDYWMGKKEKGEFRHSCPWIVDNLSYQDHIQYVHMVYSTYDSNSWLETILPIVEEEDMVAVARIKANAVNKTIS